MERISYQEVPTEIFIKLRSIEDYLEESSVNNMLLHLLKLRISQINGCAYCVDMHHKDLVKLGESELRLSLLVVWRETELFTEQERAVLDFAEAVTQLKVDPIDDSHYDPLMTFYSKEEICLISLAVTQINTWNRLMKVFRFTPGFYKSELA